MKLKKILSQKLLWYQIDFATRVPMPLQSAGPIRAVAQVALLLPLWVRLQAQFHRPTILRLCVRLFRDRW
jgi:cobalamin synthase